MSFESSRKRGSIWDDAIKLHQLISDYNFHLTSKTERDFEIGFSQVLASRKDLFSNKIITQHDRNEPVKSVYCFGKRHRPDSTILNDGIAIEIKYINASTDGFKSSIGQAYLYRLRYRFVFIILILSKKQEKLYESIVSGQETDLEDILSHISRRMNIYTCIAPSFKIRKGLKKCISFFDSELHLV